MLSPTLKFSSGQKGFTLFETLAATMILATCLVVLLQVFSGGLRSGKVADQTTRAVLRAREKMEEILLARQMREATLSGSWEDGFRWQADVSLYAPEDEDANREGEMTTFAIVLSVGWQEGEKVRLVTLHSIALAERIQDDTP